MEYNVVITGKMRSVNSLLIEQCAGVNHCISSLGRNLVVEVSKTDFAKTIEALKTRFQDVADIRKAYQMLDVLHDFILVKPLISEAPLLSSEGIILPSLEKRLVDLYSDKEYNSISNSQKSIIVQRAYELEDLNVSKLMRYARRKGKKEEMQTVVSGLKQERKAIINSLRLALQDTPVDKAWLFGSFSRMEEGPESDVDLLVRLSSSIGLFAYSSLINKLESATGRKVDMVSEGSLKPYAVESTERDKVLIYERSA